MSRSARQAADRASRNRRGFTLAELVVALVVIALVLTAVTTSISRIGRSRDVVRVRIAAHQRAIDALEALRRDIASTIRHEDLFYCRVVLNGSSIRSRVGELDRSEMLLFNTRLDPVREILYNGEGLEYEVQYRVADDRDGSALWRRRDPVPDDTPEGGGMVDPLAENVVSLLVEAYDGEAWMTDWDSDDDGLPLALRVTVIASGAGAGEDPMSRPEALVSLRTVVPIDRAPPPRDEEALAAAQQEAMEAAAAAAGLDPATLGAGTSGPAEVQGGVAVPVRPGGSTPMLRGGAEGAEGMRGGGNRGGGGMRGGGAGGGGRGAGGGGGGGGGGGARGGGGAGGAGAR